MQTPTQAPTITPTLAPVNNNQLKGEDHPRKVGPSTIVTAEPSAIVSAEFTSASQSSLVSTILPVPTTINQPKLKCVDLFIVLIIPNCTRSTQISACFFAAVPGPVPATQQQSTNHNFSTQEKTNQERSVQPTSQTLSQLSSQPVDQDLGMLPRRRALKYNDHKKKH